jgi:tRNA(fMet)-specific endonuclease VapC
MIVALDTNAYSDFLRGVPSRVDVVRRAELIYLPLIVLGELRAGFAAGGREAENLATLGQFLASPRVSILPPDEETTEHYASILSVSEREAPQSQRTICGLLR